MEVGAGYTSEKAKSDFAAKETEQKAEGNVDWAAYEEEN